MKITKNQLRKLVQEEIQKENHGEYSDPGKCDHDFFGVLLGYLGGDEDSAREFCEIIHSGQTGDTIGLAMKEFNMSADAEWEIRQAYEQMGRPDFEPRMMENIKMKITKKQLKEMILQEINISINSTGGCMEEDAGDFDEEGGEVEGEPADYGSKSSMGAISETWEDEDPYDAPPAGGVPHERPPRQEIDQVINDVIVDLERGPEQITKEDVIALLQHIANIYTGG